MSDFFTIHSFEVVFFKDRCWEGVWLRDAGEYSTPVKGRKWAETGMGRERSWTVMSTWQCLKSILPSGYPELKWLSIYISLLFGPEVWAALASASQRQSSPCNWGRFWKRRTGGSSWLHCSWLVSKSYGRIFFKKGWK